MPPDKTLDTVAAVTITNRDELGRIVMNYPGPTRGCPHCGAITEKIGTQEPITVLRHAAVECCEPRLLDEIGWRSGEIAQVQKRIDSDEAHLAKLREDLATCRPQDRNRYQARLERSERVQEGKTAGYQAELKALGGEVKRLRRKLEEVKGRGETPP